MKTKVKNFVVDNLVVIIFVSFTVFGFILSGGAPIVFFLNELIDRVFRNFFLVLSLIIPIIAGLGLNFGIVVGAMVGQLAIIFVRYQAELTPGVSTVWGGLSGFLICILLSTPLSVLCGWLTGKLYNRVRGQEMIASLIVGFFATGIYHRLKRAFHRQKCRVMDVDFVDFSSGCPAYAPGDRERTNELLKFISDEWSQLFGIVK